MLSRIGWKELVTLLLIFTMGACGGGDSSTPTPEEVDDTAPTVSSTSPADGASGVERNVIVSATFSEDMFASTIDGAGFILNGADGNVSGSVAFDATSNVATFSPSSDLAMLGSYTASLDKAITDLAGNALEPLSWGFSVRDGIWRTATTIDSGDEDANDPQIAFDGKGNAIAVWRQPDAGVNSIYANRYVAGSGWGTAVPIETNIGMVLYPQIAMDNNGNAIAVWPQRDDTGTHYDIWANHYTAGGGWGTAKLIENDDSGNALNLQITMDSSGNAIAVWRQVVGGFYRIYTNRYTFGADWGAAEPVSNGTGSAADAQIAIDGDGNAMAVRQQQAGSRYDIWYKRYEPGSGWGTATLLESDDTGNAYAPQIAFDTKGNALAVWYQYDGSANSVYANRYTAGGDWGTPEPIESDDTGNASSPQLAIDAEGNTIVVWEQFDGARTNILSNRYMAGAWGTEAPIESDDNGDAWEPQIAMDASGNALVVWTHKDDAANVDNIRTNRYVAGSGWGSDTLLESGSEDAYVPQVAIDANGNAIAVWSQSDGTRDNIWARRFD